MISLAPWPAPERSRKGIVRDLEELLAELGDVEDASRRGWLEAQTRALLAVAREDELSLEEEVEACFGIEPRPFEAAQLTAAHELASIALPGEGALAARYERWLAANECPAKVAAVIREVADWLRELALAFVGLPEGEEIEVVADALGGRYDAQLGFRVAQARRVLANVSVNLALLHAHGAGHNELLDYAREWSLQPPARATASGRPVQGRERPPGHKTAQVARLRAAQAASFVSIALAMSTTCRLASGVLNATVVTSASPT